MSYDIKIIAKLVIRNDYNSNGTPESEEQGKIE